MSNRSISRRGFIAAGASVAAMAGSTAFAQQQRQTVSTGSAAARQATGRFRRRTPIGLQLYSVRQDCAKDLEGTLAAVAKMGYRGVEFAGYYGRSAEDMKKLLDKNELVCCGTHTGMDTLLGDKLKETIEYNKTIGNKYLVVPGLPEQYRNSIQAWRDTAKLFNQISEKVKSHGMKVGYHNHSVEFQAIDGQIPWDVFMSNTNNDIIMQLDMGNCLHGGTDPLPFLYKYPGRAITVHIKEYSSKDDKALIGKGDINWRAAFALCRAVGNTEWYIVEHERYGMEPLECVDKCLQNLKEMRLVY